MSTPVNPSEVARLRAQINAEYAAAFAGLYDLSAGSARHDFIQKRMERVADLGAELIERSGLLADPPLIVEAMKGSSEQLRGKQSCHEHEEHNSEI